MADNIKIGSIVTWIDNDDDRVGKVIGIYKGAQPGKFDIAVTPEVPVVKLQLFKDGEPSFDFAFRSAADVHSTASKTVVDGIPQTAEERMHAFIHGYRRGRSVGR